MKHTTQRKCPQLAAQPETTGLALTTLAA